MVRAWLMDDNNDDQRLSHQRQPPVSISLEEIQNQTGVLYCRIDPEKEMDRLEKLRSERSYSYQDVIEISPDKLPDYDQKIKTFYKEHIHSDEEIRFILAGSGYFDVRGRNDDWIRIAVGAGDLIILPAGIYHRFTLDCENYIKAMRLFVGAPLWTPYFRPADHIDARKNYVQQQEEGEFLVLKALV